MKILKFNGIRFDYFNNVNPFEPWSMMCSHCLSAYKDKITVDMLGESNHGKCGVLGCKNNANYYIDFPAADICFANLYANDIDDEENGEDEYDNG